MIGDEMKSLSTLPIATLDRLEKLAAALIDQNAARVIVAPKRSADGYWFGGGNLVENADGVLYLCGRYRNAGDSRTGTGVGERGLELAILRSKDHGRTFEPVVTMNKAELGRPGREVISIEGTSLYFGSRGLEFYISSEKAGIPYPPGLDRFRKPGTGIWTIDVIRGGTPEELSPSGLTEVFAAEDPSHMHVKDPVLYRNDHGNDVAIYCTHPFNWSSSNSAYSVRKAGADDFGQPHFGFFPRGFTWDVSMSRITGTLAVPRVGHFANLPPLILFFYDGGESVRNYAEHEQAVRRPRGYSCEELGGLAVGLDDDQLQLRRISTLFPSFVSPYGTGSSRYVKTLTTEEGIFATWQQSQKDRSQPLVLNFISTARVHELLA